MINYLGLADWQRYLAEGILLFIGISSAAVVLSRAGKSPYFAFLLILPFINIAAVWYLAFSDWRKPGK